MTGRRRWWWRLAGGLIAFGAIEAAVVVIHGQADELRLALVVALVVCASALLVDATPVEPAVWPSHVEPEGGLGRLDPRTASYLRILESHLSAREVDAALRNRLRELADQTLRARHDLGVDDPRADGAAGPTSCAGCSTRAPTRLRPRPDRPLREEDRGAVTAHVGIPEAADHRGDRGRRRPGARRGRQGDRRASGRRCGWCSARSWPRATCCSRTTPGWARPWPPARSRGRSGCDFARAQFTPDLLPSDLTGSFLYNQRTSEFEFRRGPLFTGLLLADEINRTPPKTQSALLEAMQERQVTVEGETFPLPEPFHVLATANPIEYEGTYPLPEAQLDRFLLRVSFGYPSSDEEYDVIARRVERRQEEVELEPGHRPGRAARPPGRGRDGAGRRERRPLLRGPGRGHPRAPRRAHRRLAAWLARPGPHRAGVRGAARPRLRHPRGREGGGPRRAVAPRHGPPGALDDPDHRPLDRRRRAGPGPDPATLERGEVAVTCVAGGRPRRWPARSSSPRWRWSPRWSARRRR